MADINRFIQPSDPVHMRTVLRTGAGRNVDQNICPYCGTEMDVDSCHYCQKPQRKKIPFNTFFKLLPK